MQEETLEKGLWPPRLVLLDLCIKIHGFSVVNEISLDSQ